jgi:hypothetical protein
MFKNPATLICVIILAIMPASYLLSTDSGSIDLPSKFTLESSTNNASDTLNILGINDSIRSDYKPSHSDNIKGFHDLYLKPGIFNLGKPFYNVDEMLEEGCRKMYDSLGFSYSGSTLWSYFYQLEIEGNYAYCACLYGTLVYDISDPANPMDLENPLLPQEVSVINTPGYIKSQT